MNQDSQQKQDQGQVQNPSPSGRDRWVKIGFVLVIIVAAAAVLMHQRRGLAITGWSDDLDAALAQGGAENRHVVVFFLKSPPSGTAKAIKTHIGRPDNRKALNEGNFIPVIVELSSSLDSQTAERFKITELPTLMVLRPDGKERNRHEGNIGEIPFRKDFLNYSPPR